MVDEFSFQILLMKLSATGSVALVLAIPVGVVLVAFAWRLVRGWG
jgi:hypothetical protein